MCFESNAAGSRRWSPAPGTAMAGAGAPWRGRAMREVIAAREWLRVIRLPAYAPDLNPVEGVWSHLKRTLGNLAVHGIDDLQAIVKNRLILDAISRPVMPDRLPVR
ncbi:transposase [Nonomuraea sp. NPDC049784]|uniref:transposase n=1 Tax=Nonomuraea sp. NPDC049784 TaxID=3154361 RepID=UPI0033FE11F9